LIKEKIAPRLPDHIVLGYELYFNNEINENNGREIADALVDAEMYIAMITPGAHTRILVMAVLLLWMKSKEKKPKF